MTNLCARCGHDGDDPNTHYWGPPEVASPCRVSGCNCEDFLSMNETERNTQVSPKPTDPREALAAQAKELMSNLGKLSAAGGANELLQLKAMIQQIPVLELRVARMETNIKRLMEKFDLTYKQVL